MSTVDNLLLFRCVQFIRRLTAPASATSASSPAHLARLAQRPRLLPSSSISYAPTATSPRRSSSNCRRPPSTRWGRPRTEPEGAVFSRLRLLDGPRHLARSWTSGAAPARRALPESLARRVARPGGSAGAVSAWRTCEILARNGVALIGEKIETRTSGRGPARLLDRLRARAISSASRAAEGRRTSAATRRRRRRGPFRRAADRPAQAAGMSALFQARAQPRATGLTAARHFHQGTPAFIKAWPARPPASCEPLFHYDDDLRDRLAGAISPPALRRHLCDVWGVVHDGKSAFPAAVAALAGSAPSAVGAAAVERAAPGESVIEMLDHL